MQQSVRLNASGSPSIVVHVTPSAGLRLRSSGCPAMSIDSPQVATLDDRMSSALNCERPPAMDVSSIVDDGKNGHEESTVTSDGAIARQNEEPKSWSDDGCSHGNTIESSSDTGNLRRSGAGCAFLIVQDDYTTEICIQKGIAISNRYPKANGRIEGCLLFYIVCPT